MVGSQWLSVSTSASVGLYRTMPAAPPWQHVEALPRPGLCRRAGRRRSCRSKRPGGRRRRRRARRCSRGVRGQDDRQRAATPAVIEAPSAVKVSPLAGGQRQRVANSRVWVEAATVVTHGDRWLAVPAPGPSLPAEADTKTPAAYASRKASSTGSVNGSVPPEIEKLMTSTPSRIACPTAARRVGAEAALRSADLVLHDPGAGRDAVDGAALDAEDRRVVDDVAGRRARRVRAVAVAVASGAGERVAAARRRVVR